jgi:hypothetical protein
MLMSIGMVDQHPQFSPIDPAHIVTKGLPRSAGNPARQRLSTRLAERASPA